MAESARGDVDIILILCNQADVNGILITHGAQHFALREAAKYGRLEAVQCLLDSGAKVDGHYGTVLVMACESGHLSVVELLLKRGADLILYGDSCLRAASLEGRIDVARYLIDQDVIYQMTLPLSLMEAFRGGHVDVVDVLVTRGGAVFDTSADGAKYMYTAAKHGHLDAVKYLVDHGVVLESCNGQPLLAASFYGHVDVVRYLLGSRDNMQINDHVHINTVLNALQRGHKEVARVLLARGGLVHRDAIRQNLLAGAHFYNTGPAALSFLDRCLTEITAQNHAEEAQLQ
ncbi:ankyrin [Gonapodya prolifera JEL478]|uniref:Ankyrin n=1 Tax=Gonapodya prolifera (strain JEL478) TaxID=1344416 RepID=A0A138ZXD4_GONPJ|nr:ankyrin [Gonapodya prolifera JEL478]|eukprot:KXS08955.1 ankyrin [Gonapodya prolifera JEL478]